MSTLTHHCDHSPNNTDHLISLSKQIITKEKHMADHDNDSVSFCNDERKNLILHNNRFVIHGFYSWILMYHPFSHYLAPQFFVSFYRALFSYLLLSFEYVIILSKPKDFRKMPFYCIGHRIGLGWSSCALRIYALLFPICICYLIFKRILKNLLGTFCDHNFVPF
jgi:hypothetical protein